MPINTSIHRDKFIWCITIKIQLYILLRGDLEKKEGSYIFFVEKRKNKKQKTLKLH